MRFSIAIAIALLLGCGQSAWSIDNGRLDQLFVASTVGALMEGVYAGVISCAELRSYGDFGLGSFESLDGELIQLDGKVYKATQDGNVVTVSDAEQVTYAVSKHFHADQRFAVDQIKSLAELGKRISANVGQTNALLAVKVTGKFNSIKLRAVPKQQQPYPRLSEVAKQQREWDLHDVEGTLIGFRFPKYTGEISVPGFHFHFLSKDHTQGGHVLDVSLEQARAECDASRQLNVLLPDSAAFDNAKLDSDHTGGIHEVEGPQKK